VSTVCERWRLPLTVGTFGDSHGGMDQGLPVDLLVRGADLVATVDDERREIAGGWVAISGGLVAAVGGPAEPEPAAGDVLSAEGCLVTPGLINTHHHIYQNLTRSFRPAVNGTLFQWLATLYPKWVQARRGGGVRVGMGRPSESWRWAGCTTSTDHLYVHPARRGRPHLGRDRRRPGARHALSSHPGLHEPVREGRRPSARLGRAGRRPRSSPTVSALSPPITTPLGAMVPQSPWHPCSPFSVTPELMRATAELAERLDVRLHTHLAEDPDEDTFAEKTFGMRTVEHFEAVGWMSDRTWVAHCIYPNEAEVRRPRRPYGWGVAHLLVVET